MTPDQLIGAMALLAVLTRELLWLSAAGIALSSLDDLAVDLLWLACVAFAPSPPLPPPPAQPGRFAILVPAWDESAVIQPMLRHLLATLDHPNTRIFVGCYPNDPATLTAVGSVDDPRIELVVHDRPGPTTKADCLNRLWRAVEAHEQASGLPVKAVVLHDAEDVVHPRSLDLYDRMIPGLAMVQLPVMPLADPRSRWVSGHYIDEFAETHCKDMMVRALLDAPVPSAGVGTAIDCAALRRIAGPDGQPFDASSLTEDYEIGHRLHRLGLRGRMLRVRIDGALVATREYFPADLESAIRQKSRWLTGIALSGWDRLGWHGTWRARWMLMRDRKGLFTAAVTMTAYAAGLLLISQQALRVSLAAETGVSLPPLLHNGDGLLKLMLWLNAGILGWRLLLRACFTTAANGWREGLRAIPRAVVGNAINFLAALRAIDRYRASLDTPTAPQWDKTAHRFPETAVPHD